MEDTDTDGETECVLFGEFGWLVQFVLAGLCFSSLLYKRVTEHPRRAWLIWGLDVSKQVVSSGMAH
jgi:hypothetical protein